ncbi:MAG: KEOPS complex subunit Pcc1 [archaeon GBS-70-058]|mgnify:CR=1 FL=1|nr:KEOPS complex subunit Pcc1 [Candidatus Culexarchaeum nevadense]
MNKGVLRVYLNDPELLKSILNALTPDNKILPKGMSISSALDDRCLMLTVICEDGIGSLLNTLDELIESINMCILSIKGLQQTYK